MIERVEKTETIKITKYACYRPRFGLAWYANKEDCKGFRVSKYDKHYMFDIGPKTEYLEWHYNYSSCSDGENDDSSSSGECCDG